MDFLVDGDRRYLPLKNGYFIQGGQCQYKTNKSRSNGLGFTTRFNTLPAHPCGKTQLGRGLVAENDLPWVEKNATVKNNKNATVVYNGLPFR
jgi:hypothetical protein